MTDILQLLPDPAAHTPKPVFWATHALNQDAMAHALYYMASIEYVVAQASHPTKRTALLRAWAAMENERNESVILCKRAGGLLFAWHGSSKLVIEDAP
jgi:hypothetical protein